MKLDIGEATEDDIPTLVRILNEANDRKHELGDHIWGTKPWTDAEVRERMSVGTPYLVRKDDKVVGTVSLQWEDEENWGEQPPTAGYIHRLAVGRDFHGQGIGEAIIRWAEAQVRAKGRHYLRLDCPAENTGLCAYYETTGFTHVATKPSPGFANYTAAYFERKIS